MVINLKNIKFKKIRKGKLKKFELKNNKLKFGIIGLKSLESGIITEKQIYTIKQTILKKIKKKGKIWFRKFPNLPITKKSIGVRMGKGKGNISYWATRIKGGTIFLELCGNNFNLLFLVLKIIKTKIPLKTKIFF